MSVQYIVHHCFVFDFRIPPFAPGCEHPTTLADELFVVAQNFEKCLCFDKLNFSVLWLTLSTCNRNGNRRYSVYCLVIRAAESRRWSLDRRLSWAPSVEQCSHFRWGRARRKFLMVHFGGFWCRLWSSHATIAKLAVVPGRGS
jgi:hypothetical protein